MLRVTAHIDSSMYVCTLSKLTRFGWNKYVYLTIDSWLKPVFLYYQGLKGTLQTLDKEMPRSEDRYVHAVCILYFLFLSLFKIEIQLCFDLKVNIDSFIMFCFFPSFFLPSQMHSDYSSLKVDCVRLLA